MKEKDINSLEHTKWRCQYHIVFAPKYRRQAIYREIKTDIGKILRKLCEQKGVNIIEAEACPDHIHMLIEIPIFLSNEVKNVITEVQFRSISMDLWASIEHKIYYKSAINIPKELENRLTRCADKLDEIDLEMHNIKEEIKKYM